MTLSAPLRLLPCYVESSWSWAGIVEEFVMPPLSLLSEWLSSQWRFPREARDEPFREATVHSSKATRCWRRRENSSSVHTPVTGGTTPDRYTSGLRPPF